MSRKKPTFEVDKEGLARQLARKGKEFALLELIQNALDEDVTRVEVTLTPDSRGKHVLKVTDDSPEGFRDLAHAYTLFADSYKKDNPEQRGRFNLGEKLVIAVCDWTTIKTTKGTVHFDDEGRTESRDATEVGTEFSALIRMNKDEAQKAGVAVNTVLVPEGVEVTYNGRPLPSRKPLKEFETERSLVTEIADEEGFLKRVNRKTTVALHEPLPGEKATLYEMGLPVVETGDSWHVDVQQKVPLNTDRDNVPPSFLRELRREVLNNAADLLSEDDAGEKWVDNALEDDEISEEAVNTALDKRFGEKRVAYDPSDPEGYKIAISQGFTGVGGKSLSKKAWANVKRFDALKPAGQVTPSPKILAGESKGSSKNIPEEDWSPGMRNIANYATALARKLGVAEITVTFHNDATYRFAAWYGKGPLSSDLTFNVGVLGYRFFDQGPTTPMNDILIHEFGHQYAGDHLDAAFHRSLTRLGAQMTELALREPEFFRAFETDAEAQDTTAVPA